ncbi:MAG: hypothetical protein HY696_12350 [Deltaproteobacteria bacterium]|nr:hypothetical protein [Deltaproteobacteria bacterium]
MTMRPRSSWPFLLLLCLALTGCGAAGVPTDGGAAGVPTGGGTTTPVPIELPSAAMTIEDVPRITGPVVSGSVSAISPAPQKTHDRTTPTGVPIAQFTDADFPAGSSQAACLIANDVQLNLAAASEADYYLCLVQYAFATAGTEQTAAYYDGAYHVFRLAWSGGQGADRIRVLLDRDSDVITDFELFVCRNTTQIFHTRQQRNGTALTGTTVFVNPDGSFNYDVAVNATVNDEHQYTSKQIATDINQNSNGAMWCESSITQTASDLTENGYCSNLSGSTTTTARSSAALTILDHNDPDTPATYDVHNLAIGDGAAIIWRPDATSQVLQGWTWNSSVLVPDRASSYLADVRTQTPPEAAAQFTIDFDSSQTWNCSGTSELTLEVEAGAAYDACGRYLDIFSLEHTSCENADGTSTP